MPLIAGEGDKNKEVCFQIRAYCNHVHKCEHRLFRYTPLKTSKIPAHLEESDFHISDREIWTTHLAG